VPIVLIGGLAAAFLAVAAGVAFFFLHPKPKADADDPATHPTADSNTTGTTSDNPPLVAENLPPGTPIPATPVPATPAPATPPPAPTRVDMLKAAVASAGELEDKGDWPKSLEAWLKVAKDFPESPVGKNHLETMLNHLRDRPSPITVEEFQGMRAQILESAQLNILSAMLLIGDSLRTAEPETAAHWFSAAAEKGDPTGMVQYGLMLKKGQGVAQDMGKAFSMFQAATEKGDISGKYELASCYLNGQGVAVDAARAVQMLREVADTGSDRAMDLLGFCYDHALGVPKDVKMAVDFYRKASEKGNLEATGNLGIHYLKGEGVPLNKPRAAELFEKGAKGGSPVCMWLYASALESGYGILKNPMLATTYYKKAAAAGIRQAIDWCNENKIQYNDGN
jgi:TPR repeat protein